MSLPAEALHDGECPPVLATSEPRFRALVEALAEVVWEVDAEGKSREGAPTWSAFTGQPIEDTRGFGWMDAVHPDDRPKVRGAWARACVQGGVFQVEYRLRRSDGEYRSTLGRGVPTRDASGGIIGWTGVNVDVTEARMLEADHGRLVEELARANAFLAKVIDSVPVGIALFDLQLRTTHVNRALAEQNRLAPERHLGRPVREVLAPSGAGDQAAELLAHVRDTGRPRRDVELPWVAPGEPAEERFGLASYFPITVSGVTTALGAVIVDLTERRRTERGLDFLGRVGSLLGSALDRDATLEAVAELALPEFADWCAILVAESGAARPSVISAAHVDAGRRGDVRELFGTFALPPHAPYGWRKVLETRTPLLVEQVDLAELEPLLGGERHRELAQRVGMQSLLFVPVEERGRARGVMVLGRRDAWRRYGPGDLRIAVQVARHVGAALANARLFAAAEAGRARTERLQSITAALSSARTLDEILDVIPRSGCAAFGAIRAAVFEREEGAPRLRLLRAHGVDAESARALRDVALDAGAPISEFFAGSEELALWSPEEGPRAAGAPALGAEGAVVLLAVVVDGRRIGLVELGWPCARSLPEDERRDLLAFARLCSQAMDRGLLFDMAQRERRRAEEASLAKDQFLAMVSHELRTPLNAMLGWVTLLRGGQLGEAQREKALATVERNARTQTQLIEDLLDVTRVTSGKLRITTAPADPVRVLEGAIEAVLPAAEAKSVRVERRVAWSESLVVMDAARFQQVAGNLLSNAVKFSERGGEVRVTLSSVDGYLVLEVEDEGKGIDPAFLPHVFDAFRQAESGSTRRHSGLGLGLTIVRHIVELHGGEVRAESEGEGRGARFRVRVPLAESGRGTPELRAVAGRAGPRSVVVCPPELTGARVLVVDDDEEARSLMLTVLSSLDLRVRCLGSAEEAVREVLREPPDVIISDIAMPEEDGYSLITRVRALPADRGGRVPAVALTAHARMEDRMRAILAGFDTHVPKPVEPSELVVVLAGLLSRTSPRDRDSSA